MIPLDSTRFAELVKRTGGIGALLDIWAERYLDFPHRATIDAWRSNPRFTGNLEDYLRLCACLNVDPLALVSEEAIASASFGDLLLMLALNAEGGRGIKVQDVFGIFGPLSNWPSPERITSAFKRDWTRRFFLNDGQATSRYETVGIHFSPFDWPRFVHFAYRVSSAERWRMYGSVSAWGKENRLIHFYGPNQTTTASGHGDILVETRFGEGPCEFCLASIHEFDFELLGEGPFNTSLRFRA